MENKRFTEEDLINPALYEIYIGGGQLTTSELIHALTNTLKPQGEDAEKLFGRNDSRFSQKVRNLISHKKIYPEYVDYDSDKSLLVINNAGKERLRNSEYYLARINNIDDSDAYINDEDLSSYDETDEFEEIKQKRVDCEPINYSVFELKRRYDRAIIGSDSGVIVLDDSFQRNNVWSRKQKSQLIESLLLGIPIPYLYVYEGKNSNLIVIDGRQRLSAIFDFLDNKFALVGLEFLKHLNGKKIKDFTNSNKGQYEKYKANLEDAHLHVIRVGYETSEIFKLKIFQRVNQGGTKLNNQELRHALHQGASTVLLKELSKDIDILSSKTAKQRMKDRYLMLRYLSLRLYVFNELKFYGTKNDIYDVAFDEINTFLANSMDAINTFSEQQIVQLEVDFLEDYKIALEVLGDNAFRLDSNTPINMILFEITMLFSAMIRKFKISKEKLVDMIENIKNYDKEKVDEFGNTPFFQNIKYHRDSKLNFIQRIEWVKAIVNKYKV